MHKYKGTKGDLGAVLGIFFDREVGGDHPNDFIESLQFSRAKPEGNPVTNVNMKDLVMQFEHEPFWSYDGSLTTPPLAEGIKWTVFSKIMNISENQLRGFQQWFSHNHEFACGKGNNRVLQPLNDRVLYYSTKKQAAQNAQKIPGYSGHIPFKQDLIGLTTGESNRLAGNDFAANKSGILKAGASILTSPRYGGMRS